MPRDLHELAKLRDSLSHVYVEHAILEQDGMSIIAIDAEGRMPIPIAALTTLLIGPGCSITHAAVKALADNGCMAIWCGEGLGRFYASGIGETRSARNLMRQATLWADRDAHLGVVRRMYVRRFNTRVSEDLTLQQVRGMEGIRVREAYREASEKYGVEWKGRNYSFNSWQDSDPINRALSVANACLYGLCHAGLVSLGFSPGLGFVHSGKQLSFVYDIADLYKVEMTIPIAFQTVSEITDNMERTVRTRCQEHFHEKRLLDRMPDDLAWIFDVDDNTDVNMPGAGDLWGEDGDVSGGVNYSDSEEGGGNDGGAHT